MNFNVNLSGQICELVEMLLPRFSGRNAGLIIPKTLCIMKQGERNYETELVKSLTFLFVRPQNYTYVFVSEEDKNNLDEMDWHYLCYHDSCWRSSVDQVITQAYFKLHEASSHEGAPIESVYEADRIFTPGPAYVRVNVERVENADFRQEYAIAQIEKLTLVSQAMTDYSPLPAILKDKEDVKTK